MAPADFSSRPSARCINSTAFVSVIAEKFFVSSHLGFRVGMRWTPTYIKTDPGGYWCGYWGCYSTGNPQYANQFDFSGGVTIRF